MKALYIGQYSQGTTSKMRASILSELLGKQNIEIIDTHIPFYKTNKLFRTLGFRYKWGPLIKNTNSYILNCANKNYDLIWIDKAVYITKETTKYLRDKTGLMVHFTPDPAFTFHKSSHFIESLPFYDFAVTTKKYEINEYKSILGEDKLIHVSQGFDKNLHKPLIQFKDKKFGVVFIGHAEKERKEIINLLLEKNIPVCIAGKYWESYAKKNESNPLFTYLGTGIYDEEYVKILNNYQFGLGLLSKWIPELHTTRTFEIPACGTALITEKNVETETFFTNNEALFYKKNSEIAGLILKYKDEIPALALLSENGRKRIISDGRDYKNQLNGILNIILKRSKTDKLISP